MKCPRCEHENRADGKFCDECGTPLQRLESNFQATSSYGHAQRSLTEALARESAIGEILRLIGTSPTDAQPVFDGIARSAVNVCAAFSCAVFAVDADLIQLVATHGVPSERVARFRQEFPTPLTAAHDIAQTIRARRIFHLADIEHNPNATAGDVDNARLGRYRTRLMVPMVRGDRALGLIAV